VIRGGRLTRVVVASQAKQAAGAQLAATWLLLEMGVQQDSIGYQHNEYTE